MLVYATARYVRSSARKARIVCNHIRGKSVADKAPVESAEAKAMRLKAVNDAARARHESPDNPKWWR